MLCNYQTGYAGTCEMSKYKSDGQIGVLQFVEIGGMEFKRYKLYTQFLIHTVKTRWFVRHSLKITEVNQHSFVKCYIHFFN